MPHLMVSSMPGAPAWMAFRRCLRIGRANDAHSWMYSFTLGSRLGIGSLLFVRRGPARERYAKNDHERREQVVVQGGDRSHGAYDIAEHADQTKRSCANADPADPSTASR